MRIVALALAVVSVLAGTLLGSRSLVQGADQPESDAPDVALFI